MKIVVTSNISKVSERYRRMSKNMPGIVDQAIKDLVQTEALPLFQNTVRTWQHQPTFTPQPTARGWQVSVNPVYPFAWVNAGTRAHVIEAKNAKLLRFRVPFKAKTKPNIISSYAGFRGNEWRSKKRVNHPGNEARNFTDIIMRRMQARAASKVREALTQASYGAGMGL